MTKTTFARLVSIIGHPFTFIVLLLLVPFWRSHGRELRWDATLSPRSSAAFSRVWLPPPSASGF